VAHKSIIVPANCRSVHYHQCSEFTAADHGVPLQGRAVAPRRRLNVTEAVNVVNTSYATSHHYRSCYGTSPTDGLCEQLLARTFLDDSVLRYRRQLVDNVRQLLDTGVLPNASTLQNRVIT